MKKSKLVMLLTSIASGLLVAVHAVEARQQSPKINNADATPKSAKSASSALQKVAKPVASPQKNWNRYRTPMAPEIRQAMEADFARSQVKVEYARSLFEQRNIAGARAECLRAIELAPAINGQTMALRPQLLLGEIALSQGDNAEVLRWYLRGRENSRVDGLDLNIALCYVRMGDIANAKRFYSDRSSLQYSSTTKTSDLPGTATRKTLEASILIAHGLEATVTGQHAQALKYYDAAARIAPDNGWIRYQKGEALVFLNRNDEALAACMREAAQMKECSIT